VPVLEYPFMAELPEQDRLHFRNLALIRPQLPTEGQLLLVERLARTLASPRLLTLIARTPHWLVHGPVLQALAENEATPEAIRRDLEMVVSLFDLMRDMDRAPLGEKEERAETVKTVYQQLPPDLKPIVKQQAKLLARTVNATGFTMELPALPAGEQDWAALTLPPRGQGTVAPAFRISKQDLLVRAETTHILTDLQEFLLEADAEVRGAALRNPALSEEVLLASLAQCAVPEFFEEIYAEARWYFRDPVRETIYGSPLCSTSLARKMAASRDLVVLLERSAKHSRQLRRVVSLFSQLEESEYQFLTFWAKRRAPNMLRVIKIFFDRLQRRRANQASGLTSSQEEGRWVSLEERVFMANQATQPEQILVALRDSDPKVFIVVLENPGLGPKELIAAIPHLPQDRAERVAAHATWRAFPAVREALLHNIHLGEKTALDLLALVDTPRALLDILRDQRLPHLEVKQRALDMLRAAYAAMSVSQRILALRSSGGELLKHLTQEILRDEETLNLLVADRQLDPSILLRLARNKQTPRAILELIAAHPVLMAHSAVMQELLLNPKTPREASRRIWGLLSDSEQQQLLRSPHLPAPLRIQA
jgi:hypothetical protein